MKYQEILNKAVQEGFKIPKQRLVSWLKGVYFPKKDRKAIAYYSGVSETELDNAIIDFKIKQLTERKQK